MYKAVYFFMNNLKLCCL